MTEREQPAAKPPAGPPGGRHETELERYDRNLDEILGELRVALPGVQVLFAFLLVVPFNQRFASVSAFERRVYFGALLCTLLSSILLIAPSLAHRLTFRHGQKPYVVRIANRLMIAGLLVFAVAMCAVVLFITHYLFGQTTAIITAASAGFVFGLVWLALPLSRRRAWQQQAKRAADRQSPS